MTIVNTFFLILGMAVIGVPLLLGLLSPLVGAVVVRVFPERAWDDVMLLFAQAGAAAATFAIGFFALGLPWTACAVAAVVVGITSYARRADPTPDWTNYDENDADTDSDWRENFDRNIGAEFCPECGKRCRGQQALVQHIAAKHPDVA